MKVIAFYLPQFHRIPENDEMWGDGFTDWDNVKNAKPMFSGHEQPIEPLYDNYYDLLETSVMSWQISLAKKYGVYGFCIYHYWYNGHLLLEKPLENFLRDKSLQMSFCLCWANHDWGYSWVHDDTIIFEQYYNDRDEWESHFYYLLPYFKDERYIYDQGKPLFVIYDPSRSNYISEMLNMWNGLAKENGLKGIAFSYQNSIPDMTPGFDKSLFTYNIEYQPMYARTYCVANRFSIEIKSILRKLNKKTFKIRAANLPKVFKQKKVKIYQYDEMWQRILDMKPVDASSIPGAFVGEDTTPRKQERGFVIVGSSPNKFQKYLSKQIVRARTVYKKDYLFLFAWNEWAEGAYCEPDKKNKYAYLEAIYNALEQTGENPFHYHEE